MGAKFMFVAPAGLPEDARKVLTAAIVEIVSDPKTQVNAMINKAFSGVETISGADLDAFMASLAKASASKLSALGMWRTDHLLSARADNKEQAAL